MRLNQIKKHYESHTGRRWSDSEGQQWWRQNRAAAVRGALSPNPDFPRVYRMVPAWRLILVLFGAPILCGGAYWLFQARTLRELIGPPGVCAAAAAAAYGALLLLFALRYRVTLYVDSIEVRGAILARRRRREEITGRGRSRGGNFLLTSIHLQCGGNWLRALRLTVLFRQDLMFRRWLEAIPQRKS